MSETPRSLDHQDVDKKTDEALRQEARAHLAAAPPLQLVAELYGKLRSLDLAWWTPDALRACWSATDRMRWYRARADLRQRITTQLSGLAPRSARKKTPEFQGALLDAAIDEGDVTVRAFEEAFDPADLVVYGPAGDLWQVFVERMPWGDDAPVHQELCAWLFDALLADRSHIDGLHRKPILTAWDARTAIDGRVWHTRMPLEIRVAIDDARFEKESQRPGEPFHAESDLSIAVSATITASIPLRDLAPVLTAAQRLMGFAPRASRPAEPPPALARPSGAPPPPAAPPTPVRPSGAPPPPAAPPTPARPSVAPPPAHAPSVAPPARSVPPPAGGAASRPPPAVAAYAPPAFAPPGNAGSRRAETPSVPPPAPAAKPPPAERGSAPDTLRGSAAGNDGGRPHSHARSPSTTLPEGLHAISGEEERTNPWDIPPDDPPTPAPPPDDGGR